MAFLALLILSLCLSLMSSLLSREALDPDEFDERPELMLIFFSLTTSKYYLLNVHVSSSR